MGTAVVLRRTVVGDDRLLPEAEILDVNDAVREVVAPARQFAPIAVELQAFLAGRSNEAVLGMALREGEIQIAAVSPLRVAALTFPQAPAAALGLDTVSTILNGATLKHFTLERGWIENELTTARVVHVVAGKVRRAPATVLMFIAALTGGLGVACRLSASLTLRIGFEGAPEVGV